MDDIEIVENEVKKGSARRRRTVQLTSVVDLHFSHFGLLHFLLDLDRRPLRRLQVLHQRVVAEEIPLGRRQPRQQVVLELLQRDLELVLLTRQVRFEFLEVRPLLGDHVGQQLVLQSVSCHCEVDQRCLSLSNKGQTVHTYMLARKK